MPSINLGRFSRRIGDLVFLHDVRPGAADKSYGVQVAKLAGLPPAAVARAREVLNKLEADHDGQKDSLGALPLSALKALDVNDLSPRAALELIFRINAPESGVDAVDFRLRLTDAANTAKDVRLAALNIFKTTLENAKASAQETI